MIESKEDEVEEVLPPKEFTLGEIRITEDGRWACQWVGTQFEGEGPQFKEGYYSHAELQPLFSKVFQSMNHNKERYLAEVKKYTEELTKKEGETDDSTNA